jgi:hypothetical protein
LGPAEINHMPITEVYAYFGGWEIGTGAPKHVKQDIYVGPQRGKNINTKQQTTAAT